MITNTQLKLYYLGDRNYVNGLTLFEETLKFVLNYLNFDELSNIVIQQFKIIKFIHTHAHLELFHLNDPQQRSRLMESSGLIDFNIESNSYRVLLFSIPSDLMPESISEYDRAIYVKSDKYYSDGSSKAIIHNVSDSYELLRGIIEVNQRFTVMHAPAVGIKKSKFWAYMTNYRMLNSKNIPQEIEVFYKLKHVVSQPNRTLIIRTVEVPILGNNGEFDLCFFS